MYWFIKKFALNTNVTNSVKNDKTFTSRPVELENDAATLVWYL